MNAEPASASPNVKSFKLQWHATLRAMFTVLLACIITITCTGCTSTGVTRDQPQKAGHYSHAVIRTHMAYEADRTAQALSPYLTISDWSAVRLAGDDVCAHTLIIDTRASRGFWGSRTHLIFTDYQTKQRVGMISILRGFLYGGMDHSLAALFEHVDTETAFWSSKGAKPSRSPAPSKP